MLCLHVYVYGMLACMIVFGIHVYVYKFGWKVVIMSLLSFLGYVCMYDWVWCVYMFMCTIWLKGDDCEPPELLEVCVHV
jgi:hypothetical protein